MFGAMGMVPDWSSISATSRVNPRGSILFNPEKTLKSPLTDGASGFSVKVMRPYVFLAIAPRGNEAVRFGLFHLRTFSISRICSRKGKNVGSSS